MIGGLSSPNATIDMSSSLTMHAVVHEVEIVVKCHFRQLFCLWCRNSTVCLPKLILDDLAADGQHQPDFFRRN